MNFVDLVLILAVVVFAFSGWRQGFVAGLLSFIGFLGGGLAGVFLAPVLLGGTDVSGGGGFAITVVLVLGLAVAGQIAASVVGRLIRQQVKWRPAQVVDQIGGAGLNVAALAVIAWILAATAATLPASEVATQVRSSFLLTRLDAVVPGPARDLVGRLRGVIDTSGLPQLFDSFGFLIPGQIDAPTTAVVNDPEVQRALPSVVRVEGNAPSCRRGMTGSGFVIAPRRVLTNAHVVAGVERPQVDVPGVSMALSARTVYFDPRIDLAVLEVPDLKAPSLALDGSAPRGTDAIIAGYPGGGPMIAAPARVRGTIPASSVNGTDIYGRSGVRREVMVLRGTARPGNSGGPLIGLDGRVLGVIFAQAQDDADTAYAITSEQAAPAVAAGRAATEPIQTGPCVD